VSCPQVPARGRTIAGPIPPTPTELWSARKLARAAEIGKRLMAGRGQPPYRVERFPWAVHVRRMLSAEDLKALPEGWLDRPPVDIAGSAPRLPDLEFELGVRRIRR